MRIGEVAKRTGLKISNVRFYERKGLLAPAREEENNYREYSEEDVFRIKEILLYRKMGISVETIYLMINHQIDQTEIITRQRKELEEQITDLKGAIHLCDMVLLEHSIDQEHIDRYLDYVYQEEEKGNKFSEITELLDEIHDYTQSAVFYYRPMTLLLIRWPWATKLLSICFWVGICAVPADHLLRVSQGKTDLNVSLLVIFAFIIGIYGYGFWKYRKADRKN